MTIYDVRVTKQFSRNFYHGMNCVPRLPSFLAQRTTSQIKIFKKKGFNEGFESEDKKVSKVSFTS